MRRRLPLSLLLCGSMVAMWELGRLMPADTAGPPGALVTPVPTGTVLAWHPWASTDSAGVTSWCVSTRSTHPFPPVTIP